MCTNCNCQATFLVNKVEVSGENVFLSFRTIPTLVNGEIIKFRITEISNTITAGLPILANVNVNGTLNSVPVFDSIGNQLRSGDKLRTRTTYTAVFGSDVNHLQLVKVNGKRCLGV